MLYNQQTTITPMQDVQEPVDIQGLESITDSLQQTYVKQEQAYQKEQINLGSSVIASAYEQYPDSPEEFNKALQAGLRGIEGAMKNDEDKISFRAEMMIKANPYNAKTQQNFQTKVDKQARQSMQVEAQSTLNNIANNMSLFYTDDPASADVKAQLGQLKYQMELKDKDGNYILSVAERGKAKDLLDNPQYYGMLAWADEMKAKGNNEALKQEHSRLLKDKGKYNDEQYTKLLNATNPSEPKQFSDAQITTSLKTRIFDMDIQNGELTNNDYGREDLFVLINDLNVAHSEGKITNSMFSSNMPKLKSAYYKKESEKMFGSNSIGEMLLKDINKAVPKVTGSILDEEQRFNLMSVYYNELKKAEIDPNSTSSEDKVKALSQVIPEVNRKLAMSYGLSEDEAKDNTKVNRTLAKQKSVSAKEKASSLMKINDFIDKKWNELNIEPKQNTNERFNQRWGF